MRGGHNHVRLRQDAVEARVVHHAVVRQFGLRQHAAVEAEVLHRARKHLPAAAVAANRPSAHRNGRAVRAVAAGIASRRVRRFLRACERRRVGLVRDAGEVGDVRRGRPLGAVLREVVRVEPDRVGLPHAARPLRPVLVAVAAREPDVAEARRQVAGQRVDRSLRRAGGRHGERPAQEYRARGEFASVGRPRRRVCRAVSQVMASGGGQVDPRPRGRAVRTPRAGVADAVIVEDQPALHVVADVVGDEPVARRPLPRDANPRRFRRSAGQLADVGFWSSPASGCGVPCFKRVAGAGVGAAVHVGRGRGGEHVACGIHGIRAGRLVAGDSGDRRGDHRVRGRDGQHRLPEEACVVHRAVPGDFLLLQHTIVVADVLDLARQALRIGAAERELRDRRHVAALGGVFRIAGIGRSRCRGRRARERGDVVIAQNGRDIVEMVADCVRISQIAGEGIDA